jgi:hypothetical protein
MGRRLAVTVRGRQFTAVYHAAPEGPVWHFCYFEDGPDFDLSEAEVQQIETLCWTDLTTRRQAWNDARAAFLSRRARSGQAIKETGYERDDAATAE